MTDQPKPWTVGGSIVVGHREHAGEIYIDRAAVAVATISVFTQH
jgi:hypothetical protein